MRVLNLIQCANLGGMEQASLRLMRGLKARGDSVSLLSLNPIQGLGPLLTEENIPHEGLPYLGRGGWRSRGLLKDRLRNIKADGMIMTGHHLLAEMALGDFCRGRRILAIHFHHTGVKPAWEWRLIYRIACRRFDAITFPCNYIRQEAESIYPPVARLAHTIRYPMDVPPAPTAAEKKQARQALGLPTDRPIVGNAGWLIPRKRFDIFLRTACEILKQNPDVLFVIAGDGEERQSLQKLAGELGIAANIRWLGWQQETGNVYKSLDVLLFNSDWDTLPCVPQEAMSYGVPVVCSLLNGGLNEIINSDRYGFLLPTHDVPALAGLVSGLLKESDKASEIGLAGRAHIKLICEPEPIVEWHAQALAGNILPSGPPAKGGTSLAGPISEAKKLGRVAVLFHRVGPYHFARLRAAGAAVDTTLIEIFKEDEVYDWSPVPGADGFGRQTLFEKHPQSPREISAKIESALNRCRPTAVFIPGWSDAVAFSAVRWGILNKVPVIVMSESTEWDETRQWWKEWIKRRILSFCSGGLVGGTPHAKYLAQLGISSSQIFKGYDAVDNAYFGGRADEARSGKQAVRQKFGLPENYFLASARFVEKKNLLTLLRAYARYRAQVQQPDAWKLVLLGDGPLKREVDAERSNLGLQNEILLPGFKQYEELPAYYGLAQAFIHASTTEQWGLVVNEAMAAGLPVLVSNRCGCAQDLVRDGVNGYTFDPQNVEQLAGLMLRLTQAVSLVPADQKNDALKPATSLQQMGAASREIISHWGPDRFAEGLTLAVQAAQNTPRPQPTAIDRLLLNLLLLK